MPKNYGQRAQTRPNTFRGADEKTVYDCGSSDGERMGENTEGHSYKDKKMLYIGRTGWVKTVVLNFYTEPVGVLEGSCL